MWRWALVVASEMSRLRIRRHITRLTTEELKLEEFQAAHKGQMELYLRWLNKHERQSGEESPIGLILCEKAGDETVELLELDASSIRVASYLTQLPPKDVLQRRLHTVAELARNRLEGVKPTEAE